jgi:rhodanese-related sulfurtransferase
MNMMIKDMVEKARKQVNVITLNEAEEMREEGVTFIDVREPSEFNESAIAGAINIPRGVLEFAVDKNELLKERDKSYVLYCRCGGRAALAAESLKHMGFSSVYALNPGFYDWRLNGKRIEINYHIPNRME